MIELWKWVPGYEGKYEVSNQARVRSVDRWSDVMSPRGVPFRVYLKGKVLKETSAYTVRLFKDRVAWFVSPRRLCCEVWGIRFRKRPRGSALYPRSPGRSHEEVEHRVHPARSWRHNGVPQHSQPG